MLRYSTKILQMTIFSLHKLLPPTIYLSIVIRLIFILYTILFSEDRFFSKALLF